MQLHVVTLASCIHVTVAANFPTFLPGIGTSTDTLDRIRVPKRIVRGDIPEAALFGECQCVHARNDSNFTLLDE
jgi:hypothetical protein